MRELFCQADKNMYIDKKQAKINEATEKRDLILRVIQQLKDKGYNFSDCIYCDAKIDAYFTLRASYSFFLAEDGIYSGAGAIPDLKKIIQLADLFGVSTDYLLKDEVEKENTETICDTDCIYG